MLLHNIWIAWKSLKRSPTLSLLFLRVGLSGLSTLLVYLLLRLVLDLVLLFLYLVFDLRFVVL